jgi:hypothetical protein
VGTGSEGARIARSLQEKLLQAHAAYRVAIGECQRLKSAQASDEANDAGDEALRQAVMVHQQAKLNFEQALRDLSQFIQWGKLPPR